MSEFFCKWFLGLENSREVLDINLVFGFPIPVWVVAFTIIMLGVYSHWIYKKEAYKKSRRARTMLSVLRFITWACVVLLCLQPSVIVDLLVTPKSNLAILLDTSKSMGLAENQTTAEYEKGAMKAAGIKSNEVGKLTRLELASKILTKDNNLLLEQLAEKYALRFFSFDKSVNELIAKEDTPEIPKAEGDFTQFGKALREVSARLRGLPVAGIIAFTDGGSNKGENPQTVSAALGQKDIPIFPVGIGIPETADIKVIDVSIPDLIFVDDELAINVTFEATSLEGIDIPVSLTLGKETIGSGSVVAKRGVFQKNFVIRPTEAGEFVFECSAEVQPDEFAKANNVLKKRIRVIDSAIRILIAVGNPSWEYRYLKGMLDSDKRIETKVFIRKGDSRRARVDEAFISEFPFDKLSKEFDCLIMNNIRADYFSRSQLEKIRDYVSEDGGAMIMIASTSGTPGTYSGTPLEEMLPVTFRQIPEEEKLDYASTFSRDFKLRLTREGRAHTITRLTPLPDENAKLWLELPDQYWYYTGIKRLKPSAVALVEHTSAGNSYGSTPLMSLQRYGRGQVLFMGINSVWRWRYKIGNKLTNRFWGQTIQYMGLPHLLGSMKRVTFQTRGRNFDVGEKIDLTVRVVNPDFEPVRSSSINVIASNKETAQREQFSFSVESGKRGIFTGALFLKEGTWNVQVEGYEDEETLVLDVTPPMYEFENPAMRKNELLEIAKVSGGEYIELINVDELPEKIGKALKPTRTSAQVTLWDKWLLFIIIVCAVTTEWLLRKRVDLV